MRTMEGLHAVPSCSSHDFVQNSEQELSKSEHRGEIGAVGHQEEPAANGFLQSAAITLATFCRT